MTPSFTWLNSWLQVVNRNGLGWRWFLAFFLLTPGFSAEPGTFYINYSSRIDPVVVRAFDESIIHPEAEVDLEKVHVTGHKTYAYLSLVEVAADASYREAFQKAGVREAGRNEEWKSTLVDMTDARWQPFFLGMAKTAAEKGFDGFFLDTVDSIELLVKKDPSRTAAIRGAAVALIQALKAQFPEKKIIINRGLSIWEQVRKEISGVLIESLFQTVDLKTKQYKPVPTLDSEYLLKQLAEVSKAGLTVYILDYVDPAQESLARSTAHRIDKEGFRALISTPELDGQILAPLRPIQRRVLVVYGRESLNEQRRIAHPIDSISASMNQMPLEWLGLEVDYIHIQDDLPAQVEKNYLAVLLDQDLSVPTEKDSAFTDWLIKQKQAGLKVLVMGGLPIKSPANYSRFFSEFGLTLADSTIPLKNHRFETQSSLTGFETKLRLYTNDLPVFRAPPAAKLHISIGADDMMGMPQRFDAVFTMPWGGVASYPYLAFGRPDDDLWYIDPFAFFAEALDIKPDRPVPDSTTRDGRRIFFSHIDGDGFRHKSAAQLGKLSSELILERILKKYPLPITVSVIESEMRGLIVDQKDENPETLQNIARQMYALTNVQAGSHGWSHPFYWETDSRLADRYERRTLDLVPPHTVTDVDYQREIVGSAEYIQKELLPTGKKVEVFHWSGDCRPTAPALAIGRSAGLAMINGGGTVISRRNPSVSKIAPRGIPWDGELQVYSACENENVYRDVNEQGTMLFPGGFINVIDTFKRTETPKRLAPVNIYFHFYSGDLTASMQALQKVFDWAMHQPLQAISASEYIHIVEDARRTHFYSKGPGHYLISNDGACRTIRIPDTSLKPDLVNSRHVTGYTQSTNGLYIHTDGYPVVELTLSSSPGPHLFLAGSSAPIKFSTFKPNELLFETRDLRPATVSIGGVGSGAKVEVEVNRQKTDISSDKDGSMELKLPEHAIVHVRSMHGN